MEIYFNELSCPSGTDIDYNDIQNLRAVYQQARIYGIRTCRIDSSSFNSLLNTVPTIKGADLNIRNFLFSFFKQPYESEMVEEKQDIYLEHEWCFEDTRCFGLALCCILDCISLSISRPRWRYAKLMISCDGDEREVRNAFDDESMDSHADWLVGKTPIELIECTLEPREKRICLRKDHGADTLEEFCEKIVRSKYVLEVVNSLPFNPGSRRFIHRVRGNGLIEIVLPWTDQGLGIVVQSTGRNQRETQRIAENLQEIYGRL